MVNLTAAHRELFRRADDEMFSSLDDLSAHCRQERNAARELWVPPQDLTPQGGDEHLRLHLGNDGAFGMNHWSFSQLCSLCGVSRDTLNILSADTARRALLETRPSGTKPLQVLTNRETVRAIHGTQYSRLWNADLVEAIRGAASGFQPPQTARTGATGLYCGEQDLFAFLIDPAGWTEIGGEAFAPGLFVWNSEVGKRSLGIQTFWFQQVCGNHIVWDAVEVVEYTRKHTGNVGDSLAEICRIAEDLGRKRDERQDGFAKVIAKAMHERVGDAEEAGKFLVKHGITRSLVKHAVDQIGTEGKPFTLWTLVDTLTRLTQEVRYAGDRLEADVKVAQLLALAA